ncbi:DnaJ-domain-containing protein, partial [Atractiella rhizophila]
ELPNDCSEAEIRRSYHRLMLQHHPDKSTSSSLLASSIIEAYYILSDPERRKSHDRASRRQSYIHCWKVH